jgi:hypothetical protein
MADSHDDSDNSLPITACRLSEGARLDALPRHFGTHLLRLEDTVFDFMRQFDARYIGGYWDMFTLSNNGFYMSTGRDPVTLSVESNGFKGEMSADAAGITVCLFAYSHLSFQFPEDETFARHFYRLRAFALDHPEANLIFAAID